MSNSKQTRVEAFLARISRGAVPMGGFYWVDPEELRASAETAGAQGVAANRDGVPRPGLLATCAGDKS
jgi:hypothetical protein